MTKPSVFIGSSTEGLKIAQAIQYQLQEVQKVAKVRLWSEGVFGLGQSTLESLINALDSSDFAILVIRAEDTIISREVVSSSVRDNVLFELGLFMGRLGRSRTFMAYDRDNPPKIISDLVGISFAPYEGNNSNVLTGVSSACFLIGQAIVKYSDPKAPDEVWYTEWPLGSKVDKETLQLYIEKDRYISGTRIYEEVGETTQVYVVHGFSGKGFYWLEYHLENGSGGGAIMLHHVAPGIAKGVIIAGEYKSAVLKCYANKWILDGSSKDYDNVWLKKFGTLN